MSNKTIIRFIALCLSVGIVSVLAGCQAKKSVVQTPSRPEIVQEVDTTSMPLFPAEALYVIGREWESIHDMSSEKYFTPRAEQVRNDSVTLSDYMEQRLLELYPERMYPGYVQKVEQLASMSLIANQQSATISNRIWSELPSPDQLNATFWNQTYSQMTADSLAGEIAFLELTDVELARFDTLNALAMQSDWVDRATLDTLSLSFIEEENVGISVLLWQGPRMFYRIMQSKERAMHLAEHFYPGATSAGKRGDAFRHTFVNAMLRTYVGLPMTYLVMDVFWEHAHPNAPCDRYMDLHNNVVGRRTHYADFIQSSDTDSLPAWQQWAENVHLYIETPENGTFREWNKETPSFIVVPQAEEVDSKSYIYWGK